MDISKASNFERFIYDVCGQDSARLSTLWQEVEQAGGFDLAGRPEIERVRASGFVSGTSRHADRMATIQAVYRDHDMMIDTHTADGIKVGLEHRRAGVPLVCLETALPAKFEDAILEALGVRPPRPPGFEDIETRPRHFTVIKPDVQAVKDFIAARAEDAVR